jgi:transketolase N-terminal domain/subunit
MADTLMRDPLIQFLEEKAAEMRANVVKLTHIAGSGHIGGALSGLGP